MLPLPVRDRASGVPVWFQIMRSIEGAIAAGTWHPGDHIPSERELCAHFEVSRTSVRAALSRLEAAGIVSRHQGKRAVIERTKGPSTWTLPSAPSILGEHSANGKSALTSTILHAGIESLPPWAAAVLDRGPLGECNGNGFVVERIRSVGSRAAVHAINYMPQRFSGILPDLRDPHASLYTTLTRVVGVHITRMHRTIEAVAANRTLASLLEVEPGHPIVVVEAVAYGDHGIPVDCSRASVRTDRLRVNVETGFEVSGLSSAEASGRYP